MCLMFIVSFAQPSSEDAGEKLLEACKAGNLDTVIYHIHSGVDVNFRNEVRLSKYARMLKRSQLKSICLVSASG